MHSYISHLLQSIPHTIEYLPDEPSMLPSSSIQEVLDHLIFMIDHAYNNGYITAEEAEKMVYKQLHYLALLRFKPKHYPLLLDKAYRLNDHLLSLFSYSK